MHACMLSRFSHVWVFATLWTVAREAPLSMGFFRQKYWRGFPCLPPEDLPNQGTEPASLTSPALAGRFFTTSASWQALWKVGILQARTLECIAIPSSRSSSQPRDDLRSPTLQADSLLSELPGKPKNTGVGSLFLLQGICPTQESNQGLLHCRRILYQLSYQGSPHILNRYCV